MEKPVLADVVALSKKMLHSFLQGDPTLWFDTLSSKSVFVANGEDIIVGAEAIKKGMRKYGEKKCGTLYKESYSLIPIDHKAAIVMAKQITGRLGDDSVHITSFYTFVFKLIGKETKLIYEHTSYEYYQENGASTKIDNLPMDLNTFQFVKHLLMDNSTHERLCIQNGNQTFYLDTRQILYIKGDGNGTEIHCINQVLSCGKKLRELKEELSDSFCQIHRSYIINVRYLVSVRCYEAELISGIKLPIPSATYGKVKKELNERLNGGGISREENSPT